MATDLSSYPRPHLAVDVVLLTVLPPEDREVHERLAVLVLERTQPPAGPVLPGRFVRERETLAQTVAATLREKVQLEPDRVEPRLLAMHDRPDRDQRGWVVSAAHVLALPWERLQDSPGALVPVDAEGHLADGRRLVFDHDDMLVAAVGRMRRHYEERPDPYRLLGDTFTLSQLRDLHEAVLGERLLKDTFNRRMRQYVTELVDDGEPVRELLTGGRPAQVFVRRHGDGLTERERRRLLLPRA